MHCRRIVSSALLVLLCAGVLPDRLDAAEPFIERRFDNPIDAFSARFPHYAAEFEYQFLHAGLWSAWQIAESDGDVLPGEESELIMLPEGTNALRVRDISSADDIHPITVSKEPIRIRMAATNAVGLPGMLPRNEWGAEAEYLYAQQANGQSSSEADVTKGDNGGTVTPDQRVKDCMDAQSKYPQEFKMQATVTKDAKGREYLWPLQYSQNVRLLVVHHTALKIEGDPRPAVERVRALYKYHASSKAWGDIGYHYIIDENGQVYEGRQGGEKVVGGHAYCNNVGTVGIVLLGNFEMEQPTQKQAKGLQHLLIDLGRTYGMDLKKSVQFHGKTFDAPIVRHKDLLSTLCPGYYLSESFSQIVRNVQAGTPDAAVSFPALPSSGSPSSRPTAPPAGVQEGITFIGRTSITINPGGKQRLSFSYTAGAGGAYEGKKVADVRLSHDIRLFVDNGAGWIPVTKGILLPSDLPGYETISLQLIVEAPINPGTYTMDIGGIRFTIGVQGRRARTGYYVSPYTGSPTASQPKPKPQPATMRPRVRTQSRSSLTPVSSSATQSSASSDSPALSSSNGSDSSASSRIRIRLSSSAGPVIRFAENGAVNGMPVRAGTAFSLVMRRGVCEAVSNGISLTSGDMLRFATENGGALIVDGIAGKMRSYRGTLECRIVSGSLAVINELPLDDYLRGLAEEPDSEPYEKQRAFAIAARTYAAYYMNPANRKFPGMPYDGSDDPATFQVYAGLGFEASNPNWLRAVESTANQVLQYDGKLIKPAYFSSDDGRTRTPAEAGWKNFPAAEIFSSKPDPWCAGMTLRGHGVGMSGCGSKGQANEGKTGEQILEYYYPGAEIERR